MNQRKWASIWSHTIRNVSVCRGAVNECKAKLVEMRESVLQWCGAFSVPEPTTAFSIPNQVVAPALGSQSVV